MDEQLEKELIRKLTMEDLSPNMQELAKIIGIEKVIELSRIYASERLIIPYINSILLPARNKKIREEFNGNNIKELSIKFSLSTRQIRHIIEKRGKSNDN